MKFKWKQISGRLSSKSFLWFVSFALALSMWFLVVGNRNEEIAKTFEIPLLISNPPAGLNAYRKVQTVSVTLTGRRRAVNALENQNLTAQIDLKGVGAGTHMQRVLFHTPSRMKLNQLAPANVEVVLAREIEKTLTVKVQPPENMPGNYELINVTVSPDTVVARGREDELNTVFEAYVCPTLEQLRGGRIIKARVHVPSGVSYVYTPAEVTVEATLNPKLRPTVQIPIVVKTRGTLRPYLRLVRMETEPATVTYSGRLGVLKQLYTEPIDLSQVRKSTSIETTLTGIPQGIALGAASKVTVRIEVESQRIQREFTEIPVLVRGAEENANWFVSPSTISVSVEGDAESMKDLNADTLGLRAYVDVSGIVTPQAVVPVYVEKKDIPGVEVIFDADSMAEIKRASE
jgi:YbbR domain-containing protein